MQDDVAKIAALTPEQLQAASEGRVGECQYNHPIGTRCPNCAGWPFAKGGSAKFISAIRQHLQEMGSAQTQP
jgi:hypothetical protein